MADELAGQQAHLFEPRPTTRYKLYGRMVDFRKPKPDVNYLMSGPVTVGLDLIETPMGDFKASFLDAGANPPDGAIIHYWLGNAPEGDVTLAILDGAGQEIVSFSSGGDTVPRVPAAAGANRFIWDLRYAQPVELKDDGDLSANLLPKAVPGAYRVRLSMDGWSQSQPLTILPDPRITWTQQDLEAQRDLKLAIRDRISEIHTAANRMRRIKDQIESLTGHDGASEEVEAQGKALADALTEVEGKLVQLDPHGRKRGATPAVEKLKTLAAMIDEGDSAPTRQMHEVFETISKETVGYLDAFGDMLEGDVAAFNDLVGSSGRPPVS
jgi:hypothetical protein